jgi:hypothetical protein
MRTTLEIDDDVMLAAKRIAHFRNEPVGLVISELARRGLVPESRPVVEIQDGIPVWLHRAGAIQVTGQMVRNIADED